jgi:hypothetical protein
MVNIWSRESTPEFGLWGTAGMTFDGGAVV